MGRCRMRRYGSLCLIGSMLSLICLASPGRAEPSDWLILPEEAAMAPAPAPEAKRGILDVGRDDISIGPVIEILEPHNGGRAPMPIQVLMRFSPRLEPVDLASLKVTLVKFIQIDITDRIRPYVTSDGIQVNEAKIPPEKHRVRITLADRAGDFTVQEVFFEVL